jgi:hypothetical protein
VIPPGLRQLVSHRAGGRCEYCQIDEKAEPFFTFHVEHILPRQHGGTSEERNLALSCHHCNLHKGPNLTGIDPDTNAVVTLFNPRTQRWNEHFALQGVTVVGLTPVGRTTARLLKMNAPPRILLRSTVWPRERGSPT